MFRYQKVLQKIALLIFGLLLAYFISIILDLTAGIYLNKTGYFKAMAPNVTDIFQTSEFSVSGHSSFQGLHNENIILPKPKNIFRILALGDSFTYGWGENLSQSWPKQFEKLIKIPGKNTEVINAAVPGAGPQEYLRICKAYADYLDVDMILLGFFSTNDFYQAAETQISQKSLAKLWPTLTSISNPILTNWHSDAIPGDIFYLSQIWKEQAAKIIADHPDLESKLDPQVFKEFQIGKLNPAVIIPALADVNYLIKFLNPKRFQSELSATNKILSRIKKECIGKRPAILVFIPSFELISLDYFKYAKNAGFEVDEKLSQFDLDTPLEDIAQKNGFKYISLLSNFRKDKCPKCYYLLDTHLTPLGQKRVAEEVKKQLKL